MSSRTIVRLIDDLSGEEADETVKFALDGQDYEIDLVQASADELRAALAPYVEKARRVNTTRPPRGTPRVNGPEARAMRTWAKENGYPDIAERGRVPAEVREAYRAATKQSANP